MKKLIFALVLISSTNVFAETCKTGQLVSLADGKETITSMDSSGFSVTQGQIGRIISITTESNGSIKLSMKWLALNLDIDGRTGTTCTSNFISGVTTSVVSPNSRIFNECTI